MPAQPDPIPLLDLSAQHAPLAEQLTEAFERVLASGAFIQGPEVEALEAEVAQCLGVAHAIGVSSGTDALLVALMAAGVGAGDEVITTAYSFFSTAGCISRLGARPVLVDIDAATFNIDPKLVQQAIGPRTKAILPVHLFGQSADMDALTKLARPRSITVIEDAAQALGTQVGGEYAGTLGDLGCFSFFPSKNLGGFGDGGMVTSRDHTLAERVRALRAHGARKKYYHESIGGNFRLDALQAALLRVKLPHLDSWLDARRDNARRYDILFEEAGLSPELLHVPSRVDEGHSYNQYVIRTSERDALRDELQRQRIGCAVYYPTPLHLQPCFSDLGYSSGSFVEAEAASRESLALPIFPELGAARQQRVADVVIEFLHAG